MGLGTGEWGIAGFVLQKLKSVDRGILFFAIFTNNEQNSNAMLYSIL